MNALDKYKIALDNRAGELVAARYEDATLPKERRACRTPAEREAWDARKSAMATNRIMARNELLRRTALVEIAKWPSGAPELPSVGKKMLDALIARDLVEVRYVLTREGRALLDQDARPSSPSAT